MRAAHLAAERAKRLAEAGKDVVLLVDSLRAYVQASEKLSGDRESGLLDGKRLFALARKLSGGGSLTVIATYPDEDVPDTAKSEFESAANAVFCFRRETAAEGIIPAFDFSRSFTKRSEQFSGAPDREFVRKLRSAAEETGTAGVLAMLEKNEE